MFWHKQTQLFQIAVERAIWKQFRRLYAPWGLAGEAGDSKLLSKREIVEGKRVHVISRSCHLASGDCVALCSSTILDKFYGVKIWIYQRPSFTSTVACFPSKCRAFKLFQVSHGLRRE